MSMHVHLNYMYTCMNACEFSQNLHKEKKYNRLSIDLFQIPFTWTLSDKGNPKHLNHAL